MSARRTIVLASLLLLAPGVAHAVPEAAWEKLAGPEVTPQPAPRSDGLLLLDPDAQGFQLVTGNCRNDQWHFARGAAEPWSPIAWAGATSSCGARYTVRDPRRNRLYCLGAAFDDPDPLHGQFHVFAQSLDGDRTWRPVPTAGESPGTLLGISVVADPRRDRVLAFGGGDQFYLGDECAQDSDRVWQLQLGDTCRWSRIVAQGSPGARDFAAAVYDPHGDRLVVVGGEFQDFGNHCLAPLRLRDAWALSFAQDPPAWSQLDAAAPQAFAQMAIDTLRDRLVLVPDDMTPWVLSLTDPRGWRALAVEGVPPAPRHRPGLAFDPVHDALLTVGSDTDMDVYALRFLEPLTRRVELVAVGSGNAASSAPRTLGAAVLGSAEFSVDSVAVGSVRLAGAPARGAPTRRDVDHDGRADLVFEVERGDAQTTGDPDLAFTAECLHGTRLVGTLAARRRPNLRDEVHARVAPSLGALGAVRAGDSPVVAWTLPAGGTRATLNVYDVSGRRLATRELPTGSAGTIALDELRQRGPGVYFVRLVQGALALRSRVIVLP